MSLHVRPNSVYIGMEKEAKGCNQFSAQAYTTGNGLNGDGQIRSVQCDMMGSKVEQQKNSLE